MDAFDARLSSYLDVGSLWRRRGFAYHILSCMAEWALAEWGAEDVGCGVKSNCTPVTKSR